MSTCAVHNLQFSKASNHVSCRYRQSSEPKPVRAADESSRSRGSDSLRRAGLRYIGALSSPHVGDPTVPLTPRRSSPPSRSEDPSFGRNLARFPRRLMTDHGFHPPGRLPPPRIFSECARLGPYGPLRSIDALRERPEDLSLAGLYSRGFHRRELRQQASLDSFCSFSNNTTRDHIRGFRSPHALSHARVTSPEGPARSRASR